MSSVIIKNVVKKYGDFVAIDNVSLEIRDGEFFTLLGPSGCGKTTLLRMIAGFNSVEEGTISAGDVVINTLPAHKRNIGMVFQNYAIFPHLSVYDNVAFGLKTRNIPKEEQERRIMDVLKIVKIENLRDRMPAKLSGGQQQRVALARAIVIEPEILLMDEPLSNLDAKLRVHMRSIIRKIQRRLGITTVYVTHDQEEALAISDRIAVMQGGHIMQLGSPDDIYKKPANAFVASFIGTSNFLAANFLSDEFAQVGGIKLRLSQAMRENYNLTWSNCERAILSIRPEHISIAADEGQEGIRATILSRIFLGDFVSYEVALNDGEVLEIHEYADPSEGLDEDVGVVLKFSLEHIRLFDYEESIIKTVHSIDCEDE